MRIFSIAALAAAMAWTPALADDTAGSADAAPHLARMTLGYTYFNRAGATPAQHTEAVNACVAEAVRTIPYDEIYRPAGQGLLGGLVGSALADGLAKANWPGNVASALENCMIVRGWRVVSLSEAEGQALSALTKDDLAAKLESWVGAATPYGQIGRSWANDAANAAVPRFEIRPKHTKDGQLSLKAVTGRTLDSFEWKATPAPTPVKFDKMWQPKLLKPADVDAVQPEAAVFAFRVLNANPKDGGTISFERVGPDIDTRPSTIDRRPDALGLGALAIFGKKPPTWSLISAAPGRWRISAVGSRPVGLNLCLGSPAFDVKAGEVIYLGTFDMAAPAIGPDLALEPARQHLAGQAAADKLRPAAYVNGSTGRCRDVAIYALEIPGAPFEPGSVPIGAEAATIAP